MWTGRSSAPGHRRGAHRRAGGSNPRSRFAALRNRRTRYSRASPSPEWECLIAEGGAVRLADYNYQHAPRGAGLRPGLGPLGCCAVLAGSCSSACGWAGRSRVGWRRSGWDAPTLVLVLREGLICAKEEKQELLETDPRFTWLEMHVLLKTGRDLSVCSQILSIPPSIATLNSLPFSCPSSPAPGILQ